MFHKFKKILISTLVILIGSIILVFLALQSSRVQTYITKKASIFLKENYNIDAQIGRVNIEFFNLVKLEQVVLFDHKLDTLANIDCIKIGLNEPYKITQKIDIENAFIDDSRFKIITYPGDSVSNLQYIINSLNTTDTSTSSLNYSINLNQLILSNSVITWKDSLLDEQFVTDELIVSNFTFNDTLLSVNFSHSDFKVGSIINMTDINGNFKIVNNKAIQLNNFSLKAGNSYLKTSANIQFNDQKMDFTDYKTKYDLRLDTFEFYKKDINFDLINEFMPENVSLVGVISGTAKSLSIEKLIAKTNKTFANLSGRIKYPFIPRKTNFKLNFNALDIDKKTALFYLKDTGIADNISPLFPLHYKGLYKGNFIYNESKGFIKTPIGNVNTDLQLLLENNGKNAIYFADLRIDKFKLNTLLGNDIVGETTMKIDIEGEGFEWEDLKVKVKADIKEFKFNDYNYKDVVSNGTLEKDRYSGHLSIHDSNIAVTFDGLVDLRKNSQQLDFKADIEYVNLQGLHFSDSTSILSTMIDVTLDDINIDKADGKLLVSDFNFKNNLGQFNIDSISLLTKQLENNSRILDIKSDVFDVYALGHFKLLTFPDLIQHQIKPYLNYNQPELFYQDQSIVLNAELKKTEHITKIFLPSLKIEKSTTLTINKEFSKLPELSLHSPSIFYSNILCKEFNVNINPYNESISTSVSLDEIIFSSDDLLLSKININNSLANNTLESNISWDADFQSTNYSGNLELFTNIDTNFNLKSNITSNSSLYMADSLWRISKDNLFTYKDGIVNLSDFEIRAQKQSIKINSSYGEDSTSFVKLDFEDFNIKNINPYLTELNTEIKGLINGTISAKHLTENLELESVLMIDSTKVNDMYLGDITAISYHENEIDEAGFDIEIIRSGVHKLVSAKLKYDISKGLESFEINATVDKFKVDYADPYINEWVTNFNGRFTGNIYMTLDSLYSELYLEKIGFNVPLIGSDTRYNIDGQPKIIIDYDKFYVEEFILNAKNKKFDTKKQNKKLGQAIVRGNVFHKNFFDFKYGLDIDIYDFLCFSTENVDDAIIYGDAFVSGNLIMRGENFSPEIKVDASTSKGTSVTLAYSDQSEIAEESFIRFKKPKVDTVAKRKPVFVEEKTKDDLAIDLNLKVNPSSVVTIKVDESVLTGRGSGDMNVKINSNLEFDVYGNYTVEKADYMFAFTTGLVEAKKFDIEKGGKVIWNGDPMKGIMDIKAQYNSNLPSLDKTIKNNKEVYSIINLEGELLKPQVTFEIEIPEATDEEQVLLTEKTNSEEKLAKQFLSILIMNSFYIADDGVTQNLNNQLVSSTAGLLTSQLNKWLNDTQNEFDDVGVRINPGTGGDLNSQEIEFYLSKNFLDDRLRLNGNVGTPIGASATGVKGNFELEYDIKKDGKLKLSVFNRSGESAEKEVQYTQGVGLFYRLEFDKIFKLFREAKSTQ